MPKQVVTGALLKCSFGMAPSTFVATPKMVRSSYCDCGNIMDHVPMVNIMPFGMCNSPANPAVIAATAAAMGTPTPAPCMPATPAPWFVGAPTVPTVLFPALDNVSKCMCIWGGVIEVAYAGQMTEDIP